MQHPLQCRCGTLKGLVEDPQKANRGICYCKDCQAFAHFLERAHEILDERGGTDVIQVLPKNIVLTQGTEALACMRLTEKGLLRWYTVCCNTPVGNTLANYKISFIGLVHNCLEAGVPLQDSFGPVRAWVNTQGAKASPKPKQTGAARFASRFITSALQARFNGSYKTTPFFRRDGTPVVEPRILTGAELTKVMQAVG
ncbi:MAG TPA: DUF6151 family protein [Steroidobacteraceae bacterium]|jgi:hypothetical protein